MPFDVFGLGSALGGLFSGVGSIIGANKQAKSAEKQTQMTVDAQKEMNAANVASQEKINQQQIEHNNYINSLMRHDANNAINIKKQDLINSGYSTADPNMQGASVASLTQPQLQAPQVQSEYPAELAAINQQAGQSMVDALLGSSSVFSNLAVQKAQSRELNAKATDTEKRNSWLDVDLSLQRETAVANLSNLYKDGLIKQAEFTNLGKDFELMDKNIQSVAEQIEALKLQNHFNGQRYAAEIDNLIAEFDNIQQAIEESKSRVDVNKATEKNLSANTELALSAAVKNRVEAALGRAQLYYQNIVNRFADDGIVFGSNNWADTLSRYLLGDTGRAISNTVIDFVKGNFGSLKDYLLNFARGTARLSFGPFIPGFGVAPAVSKYIRSRDRKHIKK